jgi:hypothetical protein
MITDRPCAPLLLIVLVSFTRASEKDTLSRVRHNSGRLHIAIHPTVLTTRVVHSLLKLAGNLSVKYLKSVLANRQGAIIRSADIGSYSKLSAAITMGTLEPGAISMDSPHDKPYGPYCSCHISVGANPSKSCNVLLIHQGSSGERFNSQPRNLASFIETRAHSELRHCRRDYT